MKVLLVRKLFSPMGWRDEWYYVKAVNENEQKITEFFVVKDGIEQHLANAFTDYRAVELLADKCFLSISNSNEIVLIYDDKFGSEKLPKILQAAGKACVNKFEITSSGRRLVIKLNNSFNVVQRKEYIASVLNVIAENMSIPNDIICQFAMHAEVFSYSNITQYHQFLVQDIIKKLTLSSQAYADEMVLTRFLKALPSIFAEQLIMDTVTAVEGISAELALKLCKEINECSSFRMLAVEKIFNIHFTRAENDKAIEFLLDNPDAFKCPGIAELIPIAFAGWFGFEFGTAKMQVADAILTVDDHATARNFFELIQRIRDAIHPALDGRNMQIAELRKCLVATKAEIDVIKAENLGLVEALASTRAVAARVQQTEDLSKQLAESKLQIASLNQVISRLSLLLSNLNVVPQLRCEVATQTEFLTQHRVARVVEPEVVEVLGMRRSLSAGHRPR